MELEISMVWIISAFVQTDQLNKTVRIWVGKISWKIDLSKKVFVGGVCFSLGGKDMISRSSISSNLKCIVLSYKLKANNIKYTNVMK